MVSTVGSGMAIRYRRAWERVRIRECWIRPPRPRCPGFPPLFFRTRRPPRFSVDCAVQPCPRVSKALLPFTYRLGPGPAVVSLHVQMDASRRPIHDVVARLRGKNPDRWVVLGTHHDAWTFGGMDPGSGTSAVYETARALAALAKQGWTPDRSIVFAFWDAEEPGLVGSTEYAEAFERELRQKAVAYINTDLFMQGHFFGGGTPSLRDFLVQVPRMCRRSTDTAAVYDEWRADAWQKQPAARRRQGPKDFEVELAALGSGADFVAVPGLSGAADVIGAVRFRRQLRRLSFEL